MSREPDQQQAFWQRLWGSDERQEFWTRVDPEVARLVEAVSPERYPAVLDLGCGLGRNALPFALAGHTVTAVDLSQNGLAHLRARAAELSLEIDTCVARFTDDVFAAGQFDLVLAVNVLYHGLPADFARAVHHVCTWLRPGGFFYFTCPTLDDGEYGNGRQVAPNTFELEPGHVHYNASWADLEAMLDGFRVVWHKQRDHRWQEAGEARSSSRWQVLVEKGDACPASGAEPSR